MGSFSRIEPSANNGQLEALTWVVATTSTPFYTQSSVMHLVLICKVRNHFPSTDVTVIVQKSRYSLLISNPARSSSKSLIGHGSAFVVVEMGLALRTLIFDLVISFYDRFRSRHALFDRSSSSKCSPTLVTTLVWNG